MLSKLTKSVRIALSHENIGLLSQQITCFDTASYSGFLTMAAYMCHHYPQLNPPYSPVAQQNFKDEQSFPSRQLTYNKYLQPWCDYFNKLLHEQHKDGEITQKNHVLYLLCKLSKSQYQRITPVLDKHKFSPFSDDDRKQLLNITKFAIPKENRIHVGIINFATSQLKDEPFAPKVNLLSLLTGIWFQHTDSWRRYDVLKEDFPTEQELAKTDIFFLSGSSFSVNENIEQVKKTMELLMQALKKHKKLKIMGLCFGHQAIAKYFGGKVQKKELYAGLQVLKFNKQIIQKYPYLSQISDYKNQQFLVTQYHSDYVTQIPKGFMKIGSSKSCQYEGIISEDGRCLSFQFHSEYTQGYGDGFEMRMKKIYGMKPTNDASELLQKYGKERHEESCKIIRSAIRKFIEWVPQEGKNKQ